MTLLSETYLIVFPKHLCLNETISEVSPENAWYNFPYPKIPWKILLEFLDYIQLSTYTSGSRNPPGFHGFYRQEEANEAAPWKKRRVRSAPVPGGVEGLGWGLMEK